MDNPRFAADNKFGSYWEKLAIRQLRIAAPTVTFSGNNMELQRKGIDGLIQLNTVALEVKTRRSHCCEDILFEIKSVMETNKDGWYHTCEAKGLIYHWLDSTETRSLKAYLLNIQKIRERRLIEKYVETYDLEPLYARPAGQTWTTINVAVPVGFIPKDVLREIPPIIKQARLDDSFEEDLWRLFE